MELLYSPASPYSAKVRMAARHLGIDITSVRVDTNAEPATLMDNNPLGKIPVLLLDDGGSVYDSVAIMHYLDRLSGGKLYPKKNGKRTEVEILEALCDGIMDCLLAIVYERRFRPEDKITAMDRQAVEKGCEGPRPSQREPAENQQKTAWRPFRACGDDRLSRSAFRR